jgi:hypothetical protein
MCRVLLGRRLDVGGPAQFAIDPLLHDPSGVEVELGDHPSRFHVATNGKTPRPAAGLFRQNESVFDASVRQSNWRTHPH